MADRDFRQLLAELSAGGLLIVDRFPDRADEQVAFRTLLQLDGDVVLSIHADALNRPDFAELLAEHQRHVAAVLDSKRKRLRTLASSFGIGAGLFSCVLGTGLGYGGFVIELQSLSLEWAIAAVGTVGGVLVVAVRRTLGELTLRFFLRRWSRGLPPSSL